MLSLKQFELYQINRYLKEAREFKETPREFLRVAPVAIAPNGEPIFKCYKCGERGTNYGTKLVQIAGFKDPVKFHAVRLCERCREYLRNHDFPMKEDF